MTQQQTDHALVLLFPLAYVLGLWIVSRLTGWAALARRFPVGSEPGALKGRLYFGSLHIGLFGGYNHCVVWSVHERVLRLAPWFFLRLWHAPIELPLDALAYRKRSRFWLVDGIDVIAPSGRRLWLPMLQARHLRKVTDGLFWPVAKPHPRHAPLIQEAATGMPEPLRTA
jgi:hypothetical protein